MTFESSVLVEVEYAFSRGRSGTRDSVNGKRGAGPPLEPDDADELELLSVNIIGGIDISQHLSPLELKALERQCWEDLRYHLATDAEPAD
jgi:hypothetical protein